MKRTLAKALLVFYTFIFFVESWRPFKVHMTSFECTSPSSFVSFLNCSITELRRNRQSLSSSIKFAGVVKKPKMNLTISAASSIQPEFTLFEVTDLDLCNFLEAATGGARMISILFDILKKYSDMPKKCPFKKGTEIHVKNFIFDEHYLPPYVPDMKFGIRVESGQFGIPIYVVRLNGTVQSKEKIRPARKYT